MIPECDSVFSEKMDLTPEALTILESRYLLRDKAGNIVETPEQMCLRLAKEAARGGGGDEESIKVRTRRFYWLLVKMLFSPTLNLDERGNREPQNAACFVLPVEDSLPRIFDAVKGAALIHQSGGGTGFDFSACVLRATWSGPRRRCVGSRHS